MMQPPGVSATSYIHIDTIRWLEDAGATIVPIPASVSPSEAAAYFEYVHGLYLHSGWADQPAYATLVQAFITMATLANKAGDYFPIWGTCQGMQRLMQSVGGRLERLDSRRFSKGTRFVIQPTQKYSRLLSQVTQLKRPIFDHEYGISLYNFMKTAELRKHYRILATSHDRAGKEYVSLIEGRNLPFYGIQSHPEAKGAGLSWMADFFVAEMRKSKHMGFCPYLPTLHAGSCDQVPCLKTNIYVE